MSDFITYYNCPSCRSVAISREFTCADHTVSGKTFDIWSCSTCTLRFTQNAPVQSQIGQYYQSDNYVSHSDTKKGLINQLYHWVRNYTLKGKVKLLADITGKPKGNLLDAGAGTGAFADAMQKSGWSVVGLEPDPAARQVAFSNYNLAFLPPDSLITQPSSTYDAITLWHVLEHVHDLHGYLSTFHRILLPTGYLVIAVPNYTSFDETKYGNCWAAYDVPRHLYHFSPASMETLLRSHGFIVEQIKPMWFDSFYVSMLSEKIRRHQFVFLKGIFTGLRSNMKALRDKERCSSLIYIVKKQQ